MAVHWTDILDWADKPNDYGDRFADEGICFHTTQSGDPDRCDLAALLSTFKWQARSSSGSYNMGVGMEVRGNAGLSTDATVVTAVHMDHASGGISTRRDYIWAPSRYPFLADGLSDRAYNDPNGGLMNVVISGHVAWWMAKDSRGRTRFQRAPALIDALARIVIEFERRYGRFPLLCEHFHWQTNRSDADGRTGHLIPLVVARYRAIKGLPDTSIPAPSTTMADIDNFLLERIRIDAAANIRRAPSDSAELIFQTDRVSGAVSVGTKNGYHAYWINSLAEWGYTSTEHNVLSREPYADPAALDEARALADEYRIKLEQAENEAAEMELTIAALQEQVQVDPAALAEAERVRDEALAAKAELEASLAEVKSRVSGFVEALDALRESAA